MTISSSHPAEPDPLSDTFVAMAAARAVITATRLRIFDELAATPASAHALAERLGLDQTGVQALLSALASLGYLAADGEHVYHPTAAAARLSHGGAKSIAAFIGSFNAHAWEMLGDLDELLLGGRQADSHARTREDPYWEDYIRGLFELARDQVERAAGLVPVSGPARLLDLGGGHGAFAIAMCNAHPGLSATILDLPGSVAVGRRIVAEHGLAEHIDFREGDVLDAALGESMDLISAFNLLHHLPHRAVPALLERARAALRDGGILIIGDTERSEKRSTAGVTGAMSGLIYYVSSGTRNYARDELVGWLADAGFAEIDMHRSEHAPWRFTLLAHA